MSVKTATEQLNDALLAAYDAISAKGGTVAAQKNAVNLAASISSIPSVESEPEPEPETEVPLSTESIESN